MEKELHQLLATNGYRTTTPRRGVFAILSASSEPLFLKQIIRGCPSIDRASVYRTLELFQKLNIVICIPTGWKKRYELAEPFQPHHHHFICKNCNAVTDIQSEKLEKLIDAYAKAHGVTVVDHHFELQGYCSNCTQATQ